MSDKSTPDRAVGMIVHFLGNDDTDAASLSRAIRLMSGVIRVERTNSTKGRPDSRLLVVFGQDVRTEIGELGGDIMASVKLLRLVTSVEWVEYQPLDDHWSVRNELSDMLYDVVKKFGTADAETLSGPNGHRVTALRVRTLLSAELARHVSEISWGKK